jgi:hypothetical protein
LTRKFPVVYHELLNEKLIKHFALTRKFPVVYHELLNEKLIKHITDEMGKLMGDESTRGKGLELRGYFWRG